MALRKRGAQDERLSIVDYDLPETPSHLGRTRLS
jgi:hypothetical protein